MRYLGREWTREDLLERVGSIEQLAGIQALELTDGRARGSRLLHVYNAVGLSFDHLFQWKQMGQGAYVPGIEPANSSTIEGRASARERGDLPLLQPGEDRVYSLTFRVEEI